MSENNSIVNNLLFGAVIGTQIGNNAHAEADRIKAAAEINSLESESEAGVMAAAILSKRVDVLRQEVEALNSSELSFTCSIAGVRGVSRELLEELRKSDPKNPLLNKKIRGRVFDASFAGSWAKVNGKAYKERESLSAKWRYETYGAEGTSKSGPEAEQITPNIQVHSEAEVPSRITDREKLLGLVERLSAEVKKNNPNAPILQDKVMLDVFPDHTLNEMARLEKHKPV